ncbi:MAG: hypothetical protein MJY53_00970 [Bacteroidales bacterium]|nr:hypothetical protein [Bacteroidales bacterium]
MIRAYKVAEHTFHLELPDNSPLWNRLGQYAPFEVPPASDPVFSLTVVRDLPLKSGELVYDTPVEPGEPVIKLYRSEEGWMFEMAPAQSRPVAGRMCTGPDFRRGELCIDSSHTGDAVFCVNNSLMLLYAFCTATAGTLEMHASVIGNSGKGFLFLAKSGTGKSTHSSLWLENVPGSELINDDNPIVRIWPDGRIIVYGSPWSGKTPCYRNVECPVGAFVQIRRSGENRMTPLSLPEAYAVIYSSCSGYIVSRDMGDGLHKSMEAAAVNIPCYVLDCRPDSEAAEVCSTEVLGKTYE